MTSHEWEAWPWTVHKGPLGSFVQSLQLGAKKKAAKSCWRRGSCSHVSLPSHGIKTYGIRNVLSRAEQWIRNMLGFSVGGGGAGRGGRWQMVSIWGTRRTRGGTKPVFRTWGFASLLQLLSWWMHLHSLPCSWVFRVPAWTPPLH